MKQLTAFEAPSIKATLVPVELACIPRRNIDQIRVWNKCVRHWHRRGGGPA